MAGTAGCGVVLNEQGVRLHSCIAVCVSARRYKLALMCDFVVQMHYHQLMAMATLRTLIFVGLLNLSNGCTLNEQKVRLRL